MKHKTLRSYLIPILVLALAITQAPQSVLAADSEPAPRLATSVNNGDFETGNLSGWTTFTTSNGVAVTYVTPFDTNGDNVATYSARFGVGQYVYQGDDYPEGGGIFQSVNLVKGDLSITADIASNHPYSHCNLSGGEMQLIVDGVIADTHDFGVVCNYETKRSTLHANISIDTVGTHEIRFVALRAAGLSGVVNYLDNVEISGSATVTSYQISLDIKPGSDTNPINTKSMGLIPVAILSTPDFDAPSMVDQSTLAFGYKGREQSLAFCNENGEDVNGDGLLDLVCHFDTQLTQFTTRSRFGYLGGYTPNGARLFGIDAVTILN